MSGDMLAGWVITIIASLVSLVAVTSILYCSSEAILKKQIVCNTNSKKRLIGVNTSSIFAFGLVSLVIAIHSITVLSDAADSDKQINFVRDFESDDIQSTLLIAAFFYLIGKMLFYFVLYLRIYYLLRDSLFAYQNRFYTFVKCFIITTITSAILVPITAMIDEESEYMKIISNVAMLFYFVSDIIIPILLNFSFIYKMNQIRKFMIVAGTGRLPQTYPRSQSVTTSAATHATGSSVQTPASVGGSSLGTSEVRNVNVRSDSSTYLKEETQKASNLLKLIARMTVLSATITISSLMFVIIAIIYSVVKSTHSQFTLMASMLWLSMSVDSCINVIALILYFEFAAYLYNYLCVCCTTQCVSTCMPKCLCKCCKSESMAQTDLEMAAV